MVEVRCKNCNKLFEKADVRGVLEIVCPRCKVLNIFVLPTGLFPRFDLPKPEPIIWFQ